jgi:hypothetical protein
MEDEAIAALAAFVAALAGGALLAGGTGGGPAPIVTGPTPDGAPLFTVPPVKGSSDWPTGRAAKVALVRKIVGRYAPEPWPEFAAAVAWTESRLNPWAGGSPPGNEARGLWGMRPKSAIGPGYDRIEDFQGYDVDALIHAPDPGTVLWLDFCRRCARYTKQPMRWRDIRACMAYPTLTDEPGDPRALLSLVHLDEGIAATGASIDPNDVAPLWGWSLPAAMAAAGYPELAARLSDSSQVSKG